MAFDLCRSFSLLVVIGLLVGNSLSNAHEIPPDEVEALKIISAKLNNRYWGNISQESCIDGGESFNRTIISTEVFSNVICDCSFNNDTCHVTTIQMKGLNLSGVLPAELANLTHLQEIDLSRNYLSGSIPSSLAKLPLVILALGGNRISGTIPEELSQISTLENITVESNLLGGPLPPALGNLNRLRRFHISGNNFSEAIPESFGNLKNLTQLLTDGNTLSGKIPQFIGNWTKIQTLDLSFNMLTGQIPSTMQNLANLKFMLLTNNSLSGPVPGWILGTKHNFDVSYNNFTGLAPYDCQQSSNLNLVSSFSTTKSNSTNWCSKKDLPCPSEPKYDSLFVNCGGPKMSYNRHEYEADTTPGGASNFCASGSPNWAYSSTGVYLDNDNANFTQSNKFQLNVMSPEYYQTARLAPLSLKYYGVCLKKGSYKVQLHFAEIMFSYDDTYSRLGRRYFNVEIQVNEASVSIITLPFAY